MVFDLDDARKSPRPWGGMRLPRIPTSPATGSDHRLALHDARLEVGQLALEEPRRPHGDRQDRIQTPSITNLLETLCVHLAPLSQPLDRQRLRQPWREKLGTVACPADGMIPRATVVALG